MSHEILSAKLYELDREFGLLHGSIQLSETASREQLGQELARLRQKNEADRLAFQTKLKFSRSPMVGKLASSYETIEAFVDPGACGAGRPVLRSLAPGAVRRGGPTAGGILTGFRGAGRQSRPASLPGSSQRAGYTAGKGNGG